MIDREWAEGEKVRKKNVTTTDIVLRKFIVKEREIY